MGMESTPYIVTKVVSDAIVMPVTHKTSHAFRNDVSHEQGYKLTFISQEFQL